MAAVDLFLARAEALLAQGAFVEARELYRLALEREPRCVEALKGLAALSLRIGHDQAAVTLLREARTHAPERLDLAADLTQALARAGLHAEALDLARKLPPTPAALGFCADRLEALGQRAEALAVLARATRDHPWDVALHRRRAVLSRRAGRWAEAAEAWRALLAHAPRDAAAWSGLGVTLDALGDPGVPRALRRAVALAPEEADWVYNLAHGLLTRNRLEEALPWSRRAVALAPERAYAHTNLGVCLLGLGAVDAAVAAHRQALALDPESAEARYDLAWALLSAGAWSEGWAAHEARWEMAGFTGARAPLPCPAWSGAPLPGGGTLFLHAEQGFGDAIMMARLIAPARAQAGASRVIVEVPAPLVRLMRLVPGVDAVVVRGAPIPEAQAHLPLMSLPHRLGVTPARVPGDDVWIRGIPQETPVEGRRRVGVVWAGSSDNAMDPIRSLPADALAPLLDLPHIAWVSLQTGARAADRPDLPPALPPDADFLDTAAVIAGLDLVISVDTAVLHLAGAMGKPAWGLLAFAPDYRWMRERDTSPWYPSLRLLRQARRGDWGGVIAALRPLLGDNRARAIG